MSAVMDVDTSLNGPGERPKKPSPFLIGNDHTMTASEYEKRHRNEVPPEPGRGTTTPPSRPFHETVTVDELLVMAPADEVRAAVQQLRDAGFSDEGIVRVLLSDAKHRRNPNSLEERIVEYLAGHGREHLSPQGKAVAELAHALGASLSHLTQSLVALARAGRITRDVSNAGTTRVSLA